MDPERLGRADRLEEHPDAQLAAKPLIFPPDDVKARLYTTPAVSAADQRAAQKAMAEITGS